MGQTTTDSLPSLVPAPALRNTSITRRIPWALLLVLATLLLLLADRYRYLTHFGFVYTDGDQTTFWYQANDVAHGIFLEPCLYGQAYNPPVEAWVAAPLLLFGVPPWIALPAVTAGLALLPFCALAGIAFRCGHRWAASLILLIPLAMPIEYTVVSSLPRGFINGISVATPAVILWSLTNTSARSKRSFFLAAFFAVIALTVNPNCSIVLLAAGVFALLTHYRSPAFYLFSLLGAATAAPAPLFIAWFYRTHPECDIYRPKVSFTFSWQLLKTSLYLPSRPHLLLNQRELNLFFADFVPLANKGWIVLLVLPALVLALLLVLRIRAAIAVLLASAFAILCLGVERLHSAINNVFYSGSRMYLALPILFALALLWFDDGLAERFQKRGRYIAAIIRAVLLLSLTGFAWSRHVERLDPPSPYVVDGILPPIQRVQVLTTDASLIADACRKYNVSFVLIGGDANSCMNDAGPVLVHGSFQTLYPWFERRASRIADERTHLHSTVLIYRPSFWERIAALRHFPHALTVSRSPELLLVPVDGPARPGLDIAGSIGMVYRAKI